MQSSQGDEFFDFDESGTNYNSEVSENREQIPIDSAPIEQYDLVIETKAQKHDCKELKEFVHNYPNSFLVVPCKDCTLLRLDERRKKKYDIMCVVSLKDALNGINK